MHRETRAGTATVSERADRRDGTASVAALFDEHARSVHTFVARRLGAAVAADLTGETFRIALERWDTYDPSLGAPRAWLFGIAANLIRSHWRTEQRRLRALARVGREDPHDPVTLDHVDDRAAAAGDLARVLDAVAGLPADDRDLLTLFAWEGCTYAEIAIALGVPVGTVRSRLHRIRTVLAASRTTTREELGHG